MRVDSHSSPPSRLLRRTDQRVSWHAPFLLAALIELGEDRPPFEAFRLLPFVELVQMFLLGLNVAGKLDFGGAERLEPSPEPAAMCGRAILHAIHRAAPWRR